MNKKNLGVIIASTSIVTAALTGGIFAVTQAQDRSNAYAPTKMQRERLSLLDSFLNDDHFDGANLKRDDIGNPFALYARAKISGLVAKILVHKQWLKKELGYAKVTSETEFPINLIHTMTVLRLEKNRDAILIEFNKKTDAGYIPYKKTFLKLNLNIKYNTSMMQKWGKELSPASVDKNDLRPKLLSPLEGSDIKPVSDALVNNADRSKYLNAMDSFKTGSTKWKTKSDFTKSLIQSLIIWKVYGIEHNDPNYPKTFGDLEDYIDDQQALDPSTNIKEDIDSRFIPFVSALPYYPSEISADDDVQIINSDMDLIEEFNMHDVIHSDPTYTGTIKEMIDDTFAEFEIATLVGLELLPNSSIQINEQTKLSELVLESSYYREYSALSNIQTASEGNSASGNNAFMSALNNYEYFIGEDK